MRASVQITCLLKNISAISTAQLLIQSKARTSPPEEQLNNSRLRLLLLCNHQLSSKLRPHTVQSLKTIRTRVISWSLAKSSRTRKVPSTLVEAIFNLTDRTFRMLLKILRRNRKRQPTSLDLMQPVTSTPSGKMSKTSAWIKIELNA